jgi:hypothetical protein
MPILNHDDFITNADNICINSSNSIVDNNRTDNNCIIGELASHTTSCANDSANIQCNISRSIIIYRFKFINEFIEDLYKFSKIHQYDSRQDFKEAWKIWTEENSDIIEEETSRLTRLGYDGDILDKMFKSARYYFRKKSTEKKEPKLRRQYINITRDVLNSMDAHININMSNEDYKPKTGFVSYCKDNELLLRVTIKQMYDNGITDSQLIQDKIKKTYKNRYFMITNIK